MSMRWAFSSCLLISLWLSSSVGATPGDIADVIEGFMAKQFPGALSHLWVINSAERPAANEVVVDLNTIVVGGTNQEPNESRFLLLIVEGRLAATQNIPLDSKVDCQPEAAAAWLVLNQNRGPQYTNAPSA
jgi:hypothetical protein